MGLERRKREQAVFLLQKHQRCCLAIHCPAGASRSLPPSPHHTHILKQVPRPQGRELVAGGGRHRIQHAAGYQARHATGGGAGQPWCQHAQRRKPACPGQSHPGLASRKLQVCRSVHDFSPLRLGPACTCRSARLRCGSTLWRPRRWAARASPSSSCATRTWDATR